MAFQSVGIIGFGAFGKLLATQLHSKFDETLVFDKVLNELPKYVRSSTIREIAQQDLIFIAVPFASFELVLADLSESIRPKATVVDVCSVKLKPIAAMEELLPEGVNIVGSHPLFGPQTANESSKTVVVCEARGSAQDTIELYESLGWKVFKMSPEEHDKQMATVHALTCFVSQALLNMKLDVPELSTDFYAHLQRLMAVQKEHSQALTETIEIDNPYAADMRERFLDTANKLNERFSQVD